MEDVEVLLGLDFVMVVTLIVDSDDIVVKGGMPVCNGSVMISVSLVVTGMLSGVLAGLPFTSATPVEGAAPCADTKETTKTTQRINLRAV